MSTSVVQFGRRSGVSKKAMVLPEEAGRAMKPPDLRQVTVLPKAEWLRIQNSLVQENKHHESVMEASKQREAMHLRSKEVVKFWTNTIAGQRQKKLEARKIREEIEEEQRKLIDIEEAQYQQQKRKEAIVKAKAQHYYQTDRVKGFHSALLLTEVLKEREAQIELKKMKQCTSEDVEGHIIAEARRREAEALRLEQQKALQRKLNIQTLTEELLKQAKVHDLAREREKLEDKMEGEEIQRLTELHQWEQSTEKQRKADEKISIMNEHLEHLSNKEIIQAIDAQKQEVEEQQRRLHASGKRKMMKLRQKKEAEMFKEVQMRRDAILKTMIAQHQEQAANEDALIAKAVAEREAKVNKEKQKEEKKKAAMLKSIAEHYDSTIREREQNKILEQQAACDLLYAKKEADRIFHEKQQLKAQKVKEDGRVLQDFQRLQMIEKQSANQRLIKEMQFFEVQTAKLIVEEEQQFQQYAGQVINTAAQAKRNVLPMVKAARVGIGGGLGPLFGGVRPSYLVQDDSGVQMPNYVGDESQDIKELHEATDIHHAKKTLGFTW